jgi:hypothetical protein
MGNGKENGKENEKEKEKEKENDKCAYSVLHHLAKKRKEKKRKEKKRKDNIQSSTVRAVPAGVTLVEPLRKTKLDDKWRYVVEPKLVDACVDVKGDGTHGTRGTHGIGIEHT